VRIAVEESLIMVTANEGDFVREIERYRAQSAVTQCREANGLVIVPGDLRTLDYARLTKALGAVRFRDRTVTWPNVSDDNLRVGVSHDMRATVTPMRRCHYCEKAAGLPGVGR
jgi:hypothetical protein